jgi:formylglycine-generating enzyme required for sulfatase activity
MIVFSACAHKQPDNFILVRGGTFVNTKSNLYGKNVMLPDFYIGAYEITQKEWNEVMDSNPSEFKGDNLPVDTVSWYDCVEYCNKRSIKEGLEPYYNIDKDQKDPNNFSEYDDMKWTVTIKAGVNGYRLPTEAEWEYAAGGGQKSKNYTYSGSDKAEDVAWYFINSGDKTLSGDWSWPAIESNHNKTKPVGSKAPNELGLYDMSGNVREWCWDWYTDVLDSSSGAVRSWRGGGWLGDDQACETSYRGNFEANGKGSDQGFRVCRNK